MPRHFNRVSSLAVAAVLSLALVPALGIQPTLAGTQIKVTTTADGVVADGKCSLREAVIAANTDKAVGGCPAGHGADTIIVPAGSYVLSLAGQQENAGRTGDLDVTADVTIRGAGYATTTIDANQIDRVFQIQAGPHVTIDGLAVSGGQLTGAYLPGVANVGAGIANFADLTIVHSLITANHWAGDLQMPNLGGAIFNSGKLTVRDSVISDNSAGAGGGIYSTGSAYVSRTLVEGNSAYGWASHAPVGLNQEVGSDVRTRGGDAGGITAAGYLSVDRSVVRNNGGDSEWGHGGISMERGVVSNSLIEDNSGADCGTGGLVIVGGSLIASTVYQNQNGNCGPAAGGVYALDSQIVNSTITSNGSGLAAGGGKAARTSIVSSTITLNHSGLGDVSFIYVGGLEAEQVALRDTIVAGNVGGTGYPNWGPWPDCAGTVVSGGHNLIGSTVGCPLTAQKSDLLNVSARLAPIADNGGPQAGPDGYLEPLLTHTPLRGSPAIDAWFDGTVGNGATCPALDERGVHRPQDGNGDGVKKCDIGAIEWTR